jgi:uncharacterized membrane protein
MAKLTSKENEFKTTHGLLKLIVLVGGASVIAVVAFLFYMAFLGTPAQSQISHKILMILGTGLGGAGIFRLLSEGVKKFLQKPSS